MCAAPQGGSPSCHISATIDRWISTVGHPGDSVMRFNAGMTDPLQMEPRMTPERTHAPGLHRRVILDMLDLVLRGTIAAVTLAALAMALIAFAAS